MLREGPVKLKALLPTFGAKPGKVGEIGTSEANENLVPIETEWECSATRN